MPLGPSQVHPQQHLGEVGGVDATCAGADRDERFAGVVLAGEQRTDLQLLDRLAQRRDLGDHLAERVGVGFVLREIEQHAGVVEAAAEALDLPDLGLHVGQLGRDLLGARLVLPERRLGCRRLEFVLLLAHTRQVEDGLDGAQNLVEAFQLLVIINFGHRR